MPSLDLAVFIFYSSTLLEQEKKMEERVKLRFSTCVATQISGFFFFFFGRFAFNVDSRISKRIKTKTISPNVLDPNSVMAMFMYMECWTDLDLGKIFEKDLDLCRSLALALALALALSLSLSLSLFLSISLSFFFFLSLSISLSLSLSLSLCIFHCMYPNHIHPCFALN